jgi:hypothetical protein
MPNSNIVPGTGDVFLGLGVELLMVGIATGVASISDDVGTIMVVFMAGLFLIWLMNHVAFTNTIPGIFNYLQKKGVAA